MARTDDEKLNDIKSRLEQLKNNRVKFEGRWKEAQQYVAPNVYNWTNLEAIPELPERYTSAPCNYLATLVSGLVGYSISPNIVWFKLSLEDTEQLKLYGVKDYLENVEDIMNAEFNRSNLYKQAAPMIEGAATIGHGVMLVDENISERSLRFSTIRNNEIFLDCNDAGKVDTVYRTYVMTIRNAVEFFGLDDLCEDIKDAYENVGRWNDRIEVLQAVFPRKERNTKFKDSKNMPYACFYIDMTHNKIIKESGYNEMPFAVFEWDQIPGLAYSNSPAVNALPTIKFLNIAEKTSMQIAQTSARPPMKANQDIRNINIMPGAFTYLPHNDSTLEVIKTGENYPITLDVTQRIQQEVKDWFNVDFFLMLQQKQRDMTATEVMELQGEKAAVLANMIVSLNSALSSIISRSFYLLDRAGKLPPAPQALMDQGATMKIDFMGPLAVAQKKYHTSGGIASATQLASGIMQMFPNAGDYIDGDELIKRALEGQGMPQAVIREEDDVQKIRQQRAQQQAMQQQQAQQQAMLQSVMQNSNKLNEQVTPGSVMDQLNSQLAGGMSNGNA